MPYVCSRHSGFPFCTPQYWPAGHEALEHWTLPPRVGHVHFVEQLLSVQNSEPTG